MSDLNYQISEDKELRREENRLNHFEKLTTILGEVRNQLQEMDGSILEQLEFSRKLLSEAEQIDPACTEMLAGIETVFFQLENSTKHMCFSVKLGKF